MIYHVKSSIKPVFIFGTCEYTMGVVRNHEGLLRSSIKQLVIEKQSLNSQRRRKITSTRVVHHIEPTHYVKPQDKRPRQEVPGDFEVQKRPKKAQDPKSMKRSRALFGNLLGHLKKAKLGLDVEQHTKQAETRRAQLTKVEQKLDDQHKHLQELRAKAVENRKKQDAERLQDINKRLAIKESALMKLQIEKHYQTMKNFIKTRAQPTIFWIPAVHNEASRKLQAESQAAIDMKIASLKGYREHLERSINEEDEAREQKHAEKYIEKYTKKKTEKINNTDRRSSSGMDSNHNNSNVNSKHKAKLNSDENIKKNSKNTDKINIDENSKKNSKNDDKQSSDEDSDNSPKNDDKPIRDENSVENDKKNSNKNSKNNDKQKMDENSDENNKTNSNSKNNDKQNRDETSDANNKTNSKKTSKNNDKQNIDENSDENSKTNSKNNDKLSIDKDIDNKKYSKNNNKIISNENNNTNKNKSNRKSNNSSSSSENDINDKIEMTVNCDDDSQ